MKSLIESVFAEDPPGVVLGESEVATLSGEEPHRAALLLEEEHYLGAARPVGRTLVQAVHYQEQWVALLVWSPAALKLADRDHDLGWTDSQRAERIGLIVQTAASWCSPRPACPTSPRARWLWPSTPCPRRGRKSTVTGRC